MMDEVLIIGVAGGTGSGKTSLTRRIAERFPEDVCVIAYDNYYKAHHELSYEERCRLNYDCPEAFDTELLIEQLNCLKQGQAIECPTYDYTVHNRSETTLKIEPKKVIVVEGIMIFTDPRLCELMDIRIFVDTDADVRILRRILRDVRERARSLESVIDQYLTTVKPMHELYVEPSKKNAHLIVPEGGHNRVALDMIFERIRKHLNESA